MTLSIRRIALAGTLALALVAPACSSGGSDAAKAAPTDKAGSFPVQLETAEGTVTIKAEPVRIISLSPTATEMLFAIEAGKQVKAVDDQSNYPADAPMTDLSGYTPNVEAVVGLKPDLVVVADAVPELVDGLAKAKVPMLVLPAAETIKDSYAQIELLGQATGHTAAAAKLVASMQSEIDKIVGSLPKRTTKPTYYHELDDTLYSATSKTFIGSLYSLAGLTNIADAADKDGSGYPQLSQEYLVSTNPDLIFLGDTKCCGQSKTTVAARPGWSKLKAVTSGSVVELDDDIAARWGPRIVEFLHAVTDAVAKQPVAK